VRIPKHRIRRQDVTNMAEGKDNRTTILLVLDAGGVGGRLFSTGFTS